MKKIIIPIIVLILLVFTIQIRSQEDTPVITRGEDWIDYGYGDNHLLELYVNPVNYLVNNEYTPIDSDMELSDDIDYDYEVNNEYEAYFKEDPTLVNTVEFSKQGYYLTMQPANLSYSNPNYEFSINNIDDQSSLGIINEDSISYKDSFLVGIDINYKYFPTKLKEEVIIDNFEILPTPDTTQDTTLDIEYIISYSNELEVYVEGNLWNQETIQTNQRIEFKNKDELIFYLAEPYAYPSNDIRPNAELPLTEEDNIYPELLTYELKVINSTIYLTIKIPYSFLSSQDIEYPVIIDPTIVSTEYTDVADIAIRDSLNRRGSQIRWNITSIQKEAVVINNATMCLYQIDFNPDMDNDARLQRVLNYSWTDSVTINEIKNMSVSDTIDTHTFNNTNNATYNCIEITPILNADFNEGQNYTTVRLLDLDYPNLQILQGTLTNLWIGIIQQEPDQMYLKWYDKENAGVGQEPYLIINYTYTNQTEATQAILQGVDNALNNETNHLNQQIYIRYLNGTQLTGRFDVFTLFSNQRWAFNYIEGSDQFTNIPSLGNTVNVWENESLLYNEIVDQVETFINNTKV